MVPSNREGKHYGKLALKDLIAELSTSLAHSRTYKDDYLSMGQARMKKAKDEEDAADTME